MAIDQHVIEMIPSYALGSLDREERLLVERHLRTCERCAAELRAYSEVVGELAYAVTPSEPPRDLKQKIIAEIRNRERPVQEETRASLWKKFISFTRGISPAWTLASLLLILVLGAGNLVMLDRINDLDQAQTTNLSVINLDGTEVTPGAIGLIVVSKDGEHGTLIVDRLPALDESQQYQLWLMKDGDRTSGGVFSVDEDGYGSLWVSSDMPLASFNTFGITIEPKGGSPVPTGAKVLGSDV